MTPAAVFTPEEVRNQILCAAGARFALHGFHKTTMAEIAQDCKMSAANLYRYFENKSDIGAAIAQRHFAGKEQRWREVVRRPGMTGAARLETLVLENLACTYDEFANQPRIMELVEYIAKEHWTLVQGHLDRHQALVAEVLAEGNRLGEFAVSDVIGSAKSIQMATAKFCSPLMLWGGQSLEELQQVARSVVELMVRGLAKR